MRPTGMVVSGVMGITLSMMVYCYARTCMHSTMQGFSESRMMDVCNW